MLKDLACESNMVRLLMFNAQASKWGDPATHSQESPPFIKMEKKTLSSLLCFSQSNEFSINLLQPSPGQTFPVVCVCPFVFLWWGQGASLGSRTSSKCSIHRYLSRSTAGLCYNHWCTVRLHTKLWLDLRAVTSQSCHFWGEKKERWPLALR